MATSVFFASDSFGVMQFAPASHTQAIQSNLSVDTTVQNISATSSGAADMVSGTLGATPASGDVLIAVIMRADGQAVTAAPAGWALITAGSASGSRSLEVWWYRSTGIVADKGPHTFTRASGTANWCIELYGFNGSSACDDPAIGNGSASFASAATVTRTLAVDDTEQSPGAVLTAFVVGGGTISSISGAFSGTGTQEAHDTNINGTFTRGGVSVVQQFNNVDYSTDPTFGTAWTWTTSRAGHSCSIYLKGAGVVTLGSTAALAAGIGSTTSAFTSAHCQNLVAFDTSSIPDANTVSSATLAIVGSASAPLGLGGIAFGDPTTADLQARYYGTALPSNTRGNNDNHWLLSSSGFASKTLVAKYLAASTWNTAASNTLTSETAFLANVNKTGNTVLALSTSEYATGSAGSGGQAYAMLNHPVNTTLTVIHTLLATATVAASATATPSISRALGRARTITAAATASPSISRALTLVRTISATVTATPTITRLGTLARTIATSAQAVGSVAGNLVSTQLPRVVRLPFRTIVALSQQTRARISQRSNLRLPKE